MKITGFSFFTPLLAFLLSSMACSDSQELKGNLVISITDSPIDADNVMAVNLYFTNVEAKIGSDWKSLHRFEQPVGVNLLLYTGGKSYRVIDQSIDPGNITQLRMTLNLAQFNDGLVHNPQCNIQFTDGSTKPLYSFDGNTELLIDQPMAVSTHGNTDYTFDFDVRKSLTKDDLGNYIFKPSIRVIETSKAGNLSATVANYNPADRVVVFAYTAGTFNSAEVAAPAIGAVRFPNAINSSRIVDGKFTIGFLEEGKYDLVFAKHDEHGEFVGILGHLSPDGITAGETTDIAVDMNALTGS